GSDWVHDIPWLYTNKPAGARAVLSTVAGSMITVAGVTFSMTILSISSTTTQLGPRLLRNFMRDRGNQITLGVFISTFLYCLLVLRTVRNGEGSMDATKGIAEFVPHVAVMTGLLLAIASVGVLIYFIHHIPESIHVSNVVAVVGRDLKSQIDEQFPSQIGFPAESEPERSPKAELTSGFAKTARRVTAQGSGYVQVVDSDGLLKIATTHDLVLHLCCRPGDFVTEGSLLMLASPSDRVDDDLARLLAGTYAWGTQRTNTQNLRFLFSQLIDVIARALSPGVNDPITAQNCLDWIRAALETLAERQMPDAYRYDENQQLRVIAEPENFASFLAHVCDQLRPYVSTDFNATRHMMQMLSQVVSRATTDDRRRAIARQAGSLRREFRRFSQDVRGRRQIDDQYRRLIQLVRDGSFRQRVRDSGHWIGGRAA
ncbi:MAG: DUF2254 domain-containing protein, partial [Planctomycetales bacterium]|nr:DUF2254 domain-containing protein [Planctomycetales bacterium]